MALLEELVRQGNYLFRYRGMLPVFLLIAALGVHYYNMSFRIPESELTRLSYEATCLVICFIGLSIRVLTVGFTPKNTSGRNTKKQVADELNTTGAYSIVRHPLYLGNFVIWLGVALLTQSGWFILVFVLMYWLYYERIMLAEEEFLKSKFGKSYEFWVARTPAFLPGWRASRPSPRLFNWKKVLRKEKNGLLAIILVFYLFRLTSALAITQDFSLSGFIATNQIWTYILLATALYYVIIKIIVGTDLFKKLS